jgi:hypothetical protein
VFLQRRFAIPSKALFALALLPLLVPGCKDTVVQNIVNPQSNRPPTIVSQGPDIPPQGLDHVSHFSPDGVDLWVLVGDPDGLDDISLVTVDVASVELLRFVVRPDTATGCSRFGYAPGDTIDANSILPVPATFPGLSFRPLTRQQGGLYVMHGFGDEGNGFPDLVAASSAVEEWNGGCYDTPPYWVLGPIVIVPPAVPARLNAIISYADVRFHGISVTVHDATGASASSSFPDWRIVYRSPEETLYP